MARQLPIMPLAFEARQKLDLRVMSNSERLSDYLLEQERVVGAMLDSKKLTLLGPGSYRYNVTSFKVFQLEVNPVVSIAAVNSNGQLRMHATDSELDGLGLVDDFQLTLNAVLDIDVRNPTTSPVCLRLANGKLTSKKVNIANKRTNTDIMIFKTPGSPYDNMKTPTGTAITPPKTIHFITCNRMLFRA